MLPACRKTVFQQLAVADATISDQFLRATGPRFAARDKQYTGSLSWNALTLAVCFRHHQIAHHAFPTDGGHDKVEGAMCLFGGIETDRLGDSNVRQPHRSSLVRQ